jgi:hypothetical protein
MMPQAWPQLGTVDPTALVEARLQAHYAVQWLTRAARANLAPRPDDSHTNLGWDDPLGALQSRDLDASDAGPFRFGLRIAPLTLLATQGDETLDELTLEGKRDAEAGAWIDQHAAASGLRAPSSAILPYVIPPHPVAAGGRYSCASHQAEFAELANWFAAANELLQEAKAKLAPTSTGASAVRCWPHHFDMATLLSLKTGDQETTPSIGIGMSPGDDYYAQPYFYVSPWPRPPADARADPPAPGHWHTKDFFAAVITGDALLACHDRRAAAGDFITAAIAASRRLLGAS